MIVRVHNESNTAEPSRTHGFSLPKRLGNLTALRDNIRCLVVMDRCEFPLARCPVVQPRQIAFQKEA